MRSVDLNAGEFPALPSLRGGGASLGAVRTASGVTPMTSAGAQTPRFGALYQQLQREVTRYIEQGSDGGGGSSSLSTEAAWRRQQLLAGPASSGDLTGATLGGMAGGSALLNETVASAALRGGAGVAGVPAATPAQQQAFVKEVLPLAREAADRLGVAPEVLTAQAALETGWGRSPIRRSDGSSSHNFFGIKAGSGWSGEVTVATTTEVEAGQAVAQDARFRAYASPAQSFQDLASLIGGSPRYQAALGAGADARAYGQALQRGGYATDPAYADKLANVAALLASHAASYPASHPAARTVAGPATDPAARTEGGAP